MNHHKTALILALTLTTSTAAPAERCDDIDACVRLAVLEIEAFAVGCGEIFPEGKAELNKAFSNWSVLGLAIPKLHETLSPKNPERSKMFSEVATYLRRIPRHEASIECEGRYYEVLLSKEPKIMAEGVRLPDKVLDRYKPRNLR